MNRAGASTASKPARSPPTPKWTHGVLPKPDNSVDTIVANAMRSAGLLMYRRSQPEPEVLLVQPGGPFWINKDDGAWSIPKGLYQKNEAPLQAARREFAEETGCHANGDFVELGSFKQPGGKRISAWALEGDFDVGSLRSNTFSIEWPPRSGRMETFPEVDRANWFTPPVARKKLVKGQVEIIDALLDKLMIRSGQGRIYAFSQASAAKKGPLRSSLKSRPHCIYRALHGRRAKHFLSGSPERQL
jgi:predicted NUDIX family NTP pyrophosphohydrolase